MKSKWPLVRIGEVAEVYDGPHATPKKTDTGPVFLGISSLKRGRLDLSNLEHLSEDDYQKWTRRVVPSAGDVVFSYETRIGEVALIPPDLRCCLGRRMALVRTDPSRLRPRFFLYYFLGPEFQNLLRTKTVQGSTVERILLKEFPDFLVRVPPLEMQDEIATTLSALDDRLDLLTHANTTLESITHAIFKAWFIDFDPVRAKAEGREPEGIDAETAALLPSEFEESELGRIPKGWRCGYFGDLASLSRKTINPLSQPSVEFRHYSLPAYDAGQIPRVECGADIKSQKAMVPQGAVLVSKLNPRIPRVWLPGDVGENTICSTEFLPWSPRSGASPEQLYCLLKSSSFINAVQTLVTGTSSSHQRVQADQVAALPAVIPPREVMLAFQKTTAPILARVVQGRCQGRELTRLRDELLPRLISGQLRVPQAQEAVEEALTV